MSNTALKSEASLTAASTGPKPHDRRFPSDKDFFQMLAENASDMIVRVQLLPEFRTEYVSPSCYRITGYTPEEFYADPQLSFKCISQEDYNLLRELARKQGPPNRETAALRWRRKDGRTVWLEPRTTFSYNERGERDFANVIARDVTEHKEAEAQLRMLGSVTQQVSEATIVVDRDFNITYVNEAAQRLLDYSEAEMLGQKLGFTNARRVSHKKFERIKEVIKRDKFWSSLMTKRRKDGTTVRCECRLSPLYDENGQPQSYIEVLRDVTRQKETEDKLREHKRLIESILATLPAGVLVINGDDRVLLANQSFGNIFNIGRKTLKGKTLSQVMPVNQFLARYQSVKQGRKKISSLEFRRQVRGAEKIIGSRITPMNGGRTLLTFSDISQRRQEEENLYLTDRLASLGEMAAGLAHEINNPLTGILALSQLLAESELPDEYAEDITCIHAEARRAAEIVRNVLLFTRNNNYENGQSSANEVVRDVLRLREYEAKTGNIKVVTELAEGLPAIAVNRFQLQQVFLNVISNAEAAIRQTGRPGTLKVTTESAGGHIDIHFTDNGCGIRKQIMPRIFDPFFTTKEIGKGTGLGLSICYGIITKHGGEMKVRSRVNRGSTFTIRIPVAE